MVVIGLLLIAAGVAVAVAVLLENITPATLDIFGLTVQGTLAGVFLAGAGAMLAVLLGVWLLKMAASRARRRRAERKALERDRGSEVSQLEQERARLADEKARLEQELARRRTSPAAPGTATGGSSAIDLTARDSRTSTER